MQAHVIENGKVINTIVVGKLGDLPSLYLVDAAKGGVIGDRYNASTGAFRKPAPIHYANAVGQYLGSFHEDAPVPPGGIPVPFPPMDTRAVWNGSGWNEPAPPAPPVPQEVSRRRGLEALFRQHGLTLADIQAKIREVITDPDEQYLALNDLETSQTFERHRNRVIQIGAAFGLDLDALFIYAAGLP